MDDFLEQAYEKFVIKREGTAMQRKRIKKSYDADSQLLEVRSFLFCDCSCNYTFQFGSLKGTEIIIRF
jgi:hypothetical protein